MKYIPKFQKGNSIKASERELSPEQQEALNKYNSMYQRQQQWANPEQSQWKMISNGSRSGDRGTAGPSKEFPKGGRDLPFEGISSAYQKLPPGVQNLIEWPLASLIPIPGAKYVGKVAGKIISKAFPKVVDETVPKITKEVAEKVWRKGYEPIEPSNVFHDMRGVIRDRTSIPTQEINIPEFSFQRQPMRNPFTPEEVVRNQRIIDEQVARQAERQRIRELQTKTKPNSIKGSDEDEFYKNVNATTLPPPPSNPNALFPEIDFQPTLTNYFRAQRETKQGIANALSYDEPVLANSLKSKLERVNSNINRLSPADRRFQNAMDEHYQFTPTARSAEEHNYVVSQRKWSNPQFTREYNNLTERVLEHPESRQVYDESLRSSGNQSQALADAVAINPNPAIQRFYTDFHKDINSAIQDKVKTTKIDWWGNLSTRPSPEEIARREAADLAEQARQIRFQEQLRAEQLAKEKVDKDQLLSFSGKEGEDIIKEIEKPKNVTGEYWYAGQNADIYNVEEPANLLHKTEDLDNKINYFRKAYQQLPENNNLRKKIGTGLADLESTKYLRTTFLKELEERGTNPTYKNLSIMTKGNTHFLVNEDGTLLGNVSSQTFDPLITASDVGSSAVQPAFHGWTPLGKANKPAEALYRGVAAGKRATTPTGTGLTTSQLYASTTHLENGIEVTRYRAKDFWEKGLKAGWAITRPDGRLEIIKSVVPGAILGKGLWNQFSTPSNKLGGILISKFQKGKAILPNDYQQFRDYSKTAPENRQPEEGWEYGDPTKYDHYGMWDALGKPKDFNEALKKNPDWQPNELDKMYHGFSTNPNTGIWLKSHTPGVKEPGNTGWMENLGFQLSGDKNWNPNKLSLVYDPEIKRMRYLERHKIGGNIKEREDRGKKVTDQASIPKTLIRKQDGMKIFDVDDNYIKTKIHADFTEGGNGYAYPNFVPMDEIWVAKDKNKKNKEAIILHELAEVKKMKTGMSYDDAHEIANKKEMEYRRKFQIGGQLNTSLSSFFPKIQWPNYQVRPQVNLQDIAHSNFIAQRNKNAGVTTDMAYAPSEKIEPTEKAGADIYENIRKQKLLEDNFKFRGTPTSITMNTPANVAANCSGSCKIQQRVNNGKREYRNTPRSERPKAPDNFPTFEGGGNIVPTSTTAPIPVPRQRFANADSANYPQFYRDMYGKWGNPQTNSKLLSQYGLTFNQLNNNVIQSVSKVAPKLNASNIPYQVNPQTIVEGNKMYNGINYNQTNQLALKKEGGSIDNKLSFWEDFKQSVIK